MYMKKNKVMILDSRADLHFASTEQIRFLFLNRNWRFLKIIFIKQVRGLKAKQITCVIEE